MNRLKRVYANRSPTEALILKLLENPNNIPKARNVFDLIPQPPTFLYNKLIQACSSLNQPHQCLSLYSHMCLTHCPPNPHTFTFLFAAFASLPSPLPGQILHTRFVKSGLGWDAFASTALVDMYAKMGLLGSAQKVFDEMPLKDVPTWNCMVSGYSRGGDMQGALNMFNSMPRRNVVSWTAMISGYSQNGMYAKALEMFLRMEKVKGIRPNEVTLASVIPACANLGALEVGERIETYARENRLLKNLYVCNSLLEMYAKCGKIDNAMRLFDEIGERRNLCSWNSMITGLAVHGMSNEAFQLYEQMLREGSLPDDVTFVGLLVACTHGRMVAKGKELFESMGRDFRIPPKLEHYGCMVDLLGRAGELQDAFNLIRSMPMKPDSVIWGALLGACSFHNNVELAEIATESLFQLEPWNPGNYVILSNIYASVGRWDGVAKVRKMMKGDQVTKAAGWSFIEGEGQVHKFMVEDASHPRSHEIYTLLDEISRRMKQQKSLHKYYIELVELCMIE